jgi:hypothetical protein
MKKVRTTLKENERSGPEWEALKRAAMMKNQANFINSFELIPGLALSKLDYIENPELGDKNNYEFIDDGSQEELPQYSEGELMGDYKGCYSFIHTETGNAYYAKKEDVKIAPEGRMIDVYKAKVNEAFEKKEKDVARRELLYPQLQNVTDFYSLKAELEKGLPWEGVPKETVNKLLKNVGPQNYQSLLAILKQQGIENPEEELPYPSKGRKGYNIYTMFKALDKAGEEGLMRRDIVKSLYSEEEWESRGHVDKRYDSRRGLASQYFNVPEHNHTYFMTGVDQIGHGRYKLNKFGRKYIKNFEEKNKDIMGKIVRESLLEVIRSEDDWANQQIARNVDRYKEEIEEDPPEQKPESDEHAQASEAMRQFMETTDPPLYIQNRMLDKLPFQISLTHQDENYSILVIEHQGGDHDLEYELFQTFENAFKSIIGKGVYKNVQEITDSDGQPLFVK